MAEIYNKNLKFISELDLPPEPVKNGANYDIFQNYEIRANNRNNLKKYLNKNGVGTLIQWEGMLYKILKN